MLAMEMPGRLGYVIGHHRPAPEILATVDAAALFQQHCAGCHAVDVAGSRGSPAPGGVPILAQSQAPQGVLAMRIAYGRGTRMPAWEPMLAREEIWALAAFVDGLRD